MKWWGPVIATAPFIAVGLIASCGWAQADSDLPVAQGVARCSATQGWYRVQSGETPVAFILRHKAELNLSAEQSEEIEAINARLETLVGSLMPKVQKAIDDLMALLKADRVDLAAAEAKIREYAALETELSIEKLKAVERAKTLLRPEQLAKLKALPLDDGGKGIVSPGRQRGI